MTHAHSVTDPSPGERFIGDQSILTMAQFRPIALATAESKTALILTKVHEARDGGSDYKRGPFGALSRLLDWVSSLEVEYVSGKNSVYP